MRLFTTLNRTAVRAHLSCSTVRKLTSNVEPNKIEYVHPLSQLVLEHLQKERSDWVETNGLHRGLKVHKDGTFQIKFPSYDTDMSSIWTSYDEKEKKHWLTVHRGNLVGRFMLQDNLKAAWNDNKSTPEKIAAAVDSMITKIDEAEKAKIDTERN
mmetsp:Transcript_19137/g.28874  ORF Transcript_19137/g.28874 Transcript_19137/m.28874 type:complete len:155 (+) Transcript_19137:176-640(+)